MHGPCGTEVERGATLCIAFPCVLREWFEAMDANVGADALRSVALLVIAGITLFMLVPCAVEAKNLAARAYTALTCRRTLPL